MAFSVSMEAYLSLVTVMIMCIPGLLFLVKACRKRTTINRREMGLLPMHDRHNWSMSWPRDTTMLPMDAGYPHVRTSEAIQPASRGQASCLPPELRCTELVSSPCPWKHRDGKAQAPLIRWQHAATISLPRTAHVRSERGAFRTATGL